MVIRMNGKIEIKNDKDKKDKYLEHCPYDIQKAIAAQEKFCSDHNIPLFAPTDGRCFKCGDNIYSCRSHKNPYTTTRGKFYYTGITVEEAGKFHITGCPHCNKSFCD